MLQLFQNLKSQGETGRQKITQITRYGTTFGYYSRLWISMGLESSADLVINPGVFKIQL